MPCLQLSGLVGDLDAMESSSLRSRQKTGMRAGLRLVELEELGETWEACQPNAVAAALPAHWECDLQLRHTNESRSCEQHGQGEAI